MFDRKIDFQPIPYSGKSKTIIEWRPGSGYRRKSSQEYKYKEARLTERQRNFCENLKQMARALGSDILPVDFTDQDGRQMFLDRGCIKMAEHAGFICPLSDDSNGVVREIKLSDCMRSAGAERDGINHERKGEGSNHKALRLWIAKSPHRVDRAYADFESGTEVFLESADRVDVVYYGPASTVVIEVKSLDSNEVDLRRGIFQCIKYRAVMEAMDMRPNAQVIPVLVTQTPLPGDLAALARRHGIRHFRAPTKLE